jgi:hypothetical protein
MCLQVFMVPSVPKKVSPERLSKACGLRVEKRRTPVPGALHVSVDGGCSCSLMGDDADWNAPTWSFDPKVLGGVADALRLLNEEAGGLSFQATWIGDEVRSQERAAIRDVIADVLNNRIRNKHVYLVGKAAG